MTKRLSIKSYRKPDNRYSPLDLVACEGETEVDYFSELARNLRVHVHICKGDGTDPKEDPFTNVHLLIKRFFALKEMQNYFEQ